MSPDGRPISGRWSPIACPAAPLLMQPSSGSTRWRSGRWIPAQRDVVAEAAQRSEDLMVLRVVRLQLETIALGDRQRYLQSIDRVEAEPVAKEWCRGVYSGCAHLEMHR